mmetsp:Transcript_27111/g.60600  ORF Transcript_27111/g.60600 Transcript_27111/m.60600 type:complete len:100 (+) Transcript_27111:309-608(+)
MPKLRPNGAFVFDVPPGPALAMGVLASESKAATGGLFESRVDTTKPSPIFARRRLLLRWVLRRLLRRRLSWWHVGILSIHFAPPLVSELFCPLNSSFTL